MSEPALWDDMVLLASDIIGLGLKGPWKSGFYVHQASTESSRMLQDKQLPTTSSSGSRAAGCLLLMGKTSRWCSSYLGITQHLWSQNNCVWQSRVGSCHCWWVKQAVRIKPGVPQSGAMHTAHAGARVRRVAKQWEHKLATERGFVSGWRRWQPAEVAGIFLTWLFYSARWESKAASGLLLSVFFSSCFLTSGSLEKSSYPYIIFWGCCVFAEMLSEGWKEFRIKWSVGRFAWPG